MASEVKTEREVVITSQCEILAHVPYSTARGGSVLAIVQIGNQFEVGSMLWKGGVIYEAVSCNNYPEALITLSVKLMQQAAKTPAISAKLKQQLTPVLSNLVLPTKEETKN